MRFTSPQIMRHPQSRERYYLFHHSLSAKFTINAAKQVSLRTSPGFQIPLIHLLFSLSLCLSCSLSGIFKRLINILKNHHVMRNSIWQQDEDKNRTMESDDRLYTSIALVDYQAHQRAQKKKEGGHILPRWPQYILVYSA